jgi:polygalacturonase
MTCNKKISSYVKAFLSMGAMLSCIPIFAGNNDSQFQELPTAQLPHFAKDTFSIVSYGAKADGMTLNTTAINKAITACSEKGGGVVLIPQGLWLTGPIVMKSNVNLNLANGAIVQLTDDLNQYPLTEGNWEGLPSVRNQSPVSGNNLENIAITGSGIIDGNGDAWRMVKKDKLTETQWKMKIASGGVLSDDGRIWYPSEKSLAGSKVKGAGVIQPGKTIKD